MNPWRDRAACLSLDPEMFDPQCYWGETSAMRDQRIRDIRAMCAACPVAAECLAAELDSGRRPWHIRAGLDPDQLLAARDRRIRQRSRKRVKARTQAKETA